MTGRQRMEAAFNRQAADRVPHFEQLFELTEEAFGEPFPSMKAIESATTDERDRLLHACVELYARVIERFRWDALVIWRPARGPLLCECLRMAKRELGDRVFLGGFLWESVHSIDIVKDHGQFAIDLYDNPDSLHARALHMSDVAIADGRALRDAGADFVDIASDVAYNQGPFISPSMFAEFITPYLARHVAALKAEGLRILYHSDGNLMPVLDDLIGAGIEMLQSIDPMAGMDIAEVKRRTAGKIALMGNVRCSYLQEGPEDALRESARYALAHGAPGGGFVYSSSNSIFRGVPLRNYEIMLEELAAYTGAA